MKIIETITKLGKFLASGPVSENDITEAENRLGLSFSTEYKTYLQNYGSLSYYGHELTGISDNEATDVVINTISERQICDVSDDWYVIERACINDIVIWQNREGKIFQTSPGAEPQKIYDSLSDYILNG